MSMKLPRRPEFLSILEHYCSLYPRTYWCICVFAFGNLYCQTCCRNRSGPPVDPASTRSRSVQPLSVTLSPQSLYSYVQLSPTVDTNSCHLTYICHQQLLPHLHLSPTVANSSTFVTNSCYLTYICLQQLLPHLHLSPTVPTSPTFVTNSC